MPDNITDKRGEPSATATTTPPTGTLKEVHIAEGEGSLVYWPEKNAFIALFPDEYREMYVQADEHSRKIGALQAANREVTKASATLREAHKGGNAGEIKTADAALAAAIQVMLQASAEVKKKLEPLSKLDAKDGVKMVEVVSLRTPRYKQERVTPIYVDSTRFQNALAQRRIYYLSDDRSPRAAENVFKNGTLNVKEIKARIAENVQDQLFSKKWKLKPDDAKAYTGVLTEWAEVMNGNVATFLARKKGDFEQAAGIDPKDPKRNIDLSVEAQMMRYTAGAGLEVNFKPFRGSGPNDPNSNLYDRVKRGLKEGAFGIKANAQASFAIAEGRVRTEMYWPHCAGWHANFSVGEESFDFGYWRMYCDVVLSGGVGASLAVEMDVALMYKVGKPLVRGTPALFQDHRRVKARTGAGAGLNAFAGARAGADVTGALQWLNPEGEQQKGAAAKRKPGDAVAEFKDIAKIDISGGASAGLGASAAFQIKHENGRFTVYAKLGACVGIGADSSCKFEVNVGTISEFFVCVAYQLKRADFHKIREAIDTDAYEAYCKVRYLVIVAGKKLEDFAIQALEDIEKEFVSTLLRIDDAVRAGSSQAEKFFARISAELQRQADGLITYATPEVLGQILRQIAVGSHSGNLPLQALGPKLLSSALSAPQTRNHLVTIAERMTPKMGDKQSSSVGISMINACLVGTPFSDSWIQAEKRLAPAKPMVCTPFIWNEEPEFIRAKLRVKHPMYSTDAISSKRPN